MFNNPYMFNPTNMNSMPTSTQPYGSPMTNYNMQMPTMGMNTFSMNQPPVQTNTNKLYVTGIDDARNKQLPNNSDYIFLDNDKPLLYRKMVDSTGKMEFQTYEIVPYQQKPAEKSIDTSMFVSVEEFNKLKEDLEKIKNSLNDNQTLV